MCWVWNEDLGTSVEQTVATDEYEEEFFNLEEDNMENEKEFIDELMSEWNDQNGGAETKKSTDSTADSLVDETEPDWISKLLIE